MKPIFLLTFVLLCLLAVAAEAVEFPVTDVPSGVGVNIHFNNDWPDYLQRLDAIQAAGIHVARMDFSWSTIETTPGQYDFSGWDQLVTAAADRGIRMQALLCYSNSLYGNTDDPAYYGSATFRNAFTNFTSALTTHYAAITDQYQAQHPGSNVKMTYELWNEPNLGFWPGYDPNQYMALANQVLPVIRQNDPNATIVAPALSAVNNYPPYADWNDYLTTCFNYGNAHPGQQGLLSMVDGLSVHPYRWGTARIPKPSSADSQLYLYLRRPSHVDERVRRQQRPDHFRRMGLYFLRMVSRLRRRPTMRGG